MGTTLQALLMDTLVIATSLGLFLGTLTHVRPADDKPVRPSGSKDSRVFSGTSTDISQAQL